MIFLREKYADLIKIYFIGENMKKYVIKELW
jgi:hypothetical protein